MPIDIIDQDESLGVLIDMRGHVTSKEFHDKLMEHLSKPDEQLHHYLYTISDLSEITKFDIDLSYLRKVALKCNEVSKINSHVIVTTVTSDPVLYSISRLWMGLARLTGWTMQVFKNREKHDKWLRAKLKEKFNAENFSLDLSLRKNNRKS